MAEAEETLRAITSGDVDALVVSGAQGEQVFTLKDADRPYRQLIEQMTEGACTLNAQGIVLFANSSFARLLAVRMEEVLGTPLSRWLKAQDRPRFDAVLEQAIRCSAQDAFELDPVNRVSLPVELSLNLLQTEEGPRVTVVVRDLRERKQVEQMLRSANAELERRVDERTAQLQVANEELAAINEEYQSANDDLVDSNRRLEAEIARRRQVEESLRANEERYRAVFENATDAIIVTDPTGDGKVLSANPAACRLFGYDEAEFLGLDREAILDTRDPNVRAAVERRAKQGFGTAVVTYKRKDGTWFLGELSTAFFQDREGEQRAIAVIRDTTERKRMEEALANTNRKLSDVLTSIQDDFYVLDRGWKFVYVSRQFAQKVGKEPGDFIGNRIWDMFPKHVGTDLEANFRVTMEQRDIRRFEVGGKYTDAWYTMTCFPSAEGITVLGTDITTRKKHEEQLARLNRTLTAKSHSDQALMRAKTEAEYMQEVCRIIVEDCGHAMAWIGFAEDDPAKSVRPVAYAGFEQGYLETLQITWADAERGRGPTGTAIRTGQPSFCRNMTTDPKFAPWREQALARGYASSLVLPLWDNARAFGALTVYFREPDPFTDDEVALLASLADDLAYGVQMLRLRGAHAEAEARLRESEERYRAFFDNSPDAIFITSPDGRIHAANAEACRMFGYSETEMIKVGRADVMDASDPRLAKALAERERTGHFRGELNYRRKDGTIFPGEVSVAVFEDRDGESKTSMIIRDITERKHTEERIQSLNWELQTLNRDLKQRSTELALANRDLESFTYSVSHDLRTPLTAIESFAAALMVDYSPLLPEEAVQFVDLIERNARATNELVLALLALSRATRQPVKKEVVDMKALVGQILETLNSQASRPNLTLVLQDLPPAEADPVLLRQVWINLIDNALKFTRKRENARVEIGCGEHDGEGCVYYVRDNGAGFDMEQADKLFGVFQRLHGEDEFEGNGVGLALVQRIVNRHGGRVWADGKEGEGATFYFTLA